EDRFGGAAGVVVGGVDEGAAGRGEQLELLGALAFRRPPAPVGPEGHRPERKLADPQPRVAQQCVPHGLPISLVLSRWCLVSWPVIRRRCCRRRCGGWRR